MNINNPVDENITAVRDRVFKEIFYDERNVDILIGVIETCLGIKVKRVQYLNNEVPQGNYKIKGKRMDLLLDTDIGKINIELNAEMKPYTYVRNFSYVCSIYIRNTEVGDDYTEEVKVIQINLTFGLGSNPEDEEEWEVYSTYEVIKRNNKIRRKQLEDKKYVENLIIYEFNMDKIMEFWYSKNEEMIKKYKYLIMLGLESKELKKLEQEDARVVRYMKAFDKVIVSIGINDWVDEETDQRRIRNTIERQARKEGIEEGKEQNQKEMIINLHKLNTPIEVIAEASKLSIQEVEKIISSDS